MTIEWQLNDNWMTIEWLLNDHEWQFNNETMKQWNNETMKQWNNETMKQWNNLYLLLLLNSNPNYVSIDTTCLP